MNATRRVAQVLICLVAATMLGTLAAGPAQGTAEHAASQRVEQGIATSATPTAAVKNCLLVDCPDLDLPDLNPINDAWDNVQSVLGDLTGRIGDLGGALESTTKALQKLKNLDPRSWPGELAKTAAESAVSMMGKATDLMGMAHHPGWTADWWLTQYAVMLPIGLVLFAFVLILVVSKVGGSHGDHVAAVALIRDTFPRAWFAPAVMFFGPAVASVVYGLTHGFTKLFSSEAQKSSGSAMETATERIGDLGQGVPGTDAFAQLGGAFGAFLLLALVVLFMIGILFQLMVATWGVNILTLFIPVVLAMWVYPPWRQMATRMVTLVLGLMLAPAFMHLVYWTFWGAADSAISGKAGDTLGAVLFVLVAGFMLTAAPVTAAWLIPKVIPEASAATPGAAGAHASAADAAKNAKERVQRRQQNNEENRGSSENQSNGGHRKSKRPSTGDAENADAAGAHGKSPSGDGRGGQDHGETGHGEGGGTPGLGKEAGRAGHDGAATVSAPGSGGEGDGATKGAPGGGATSESGPTSAPTKTEGGAATPAGGSGPGEKSRVGDLAKTSTRGSAGGLARGAGRGAGGLLGGALGAAAAVGVYSYQRSKAETTGNANQFMQDTKDGK